MGGRQVVGRQFEVMLSFLDRVDDRNANRLEKQAQYRRDLEQQMREKENLTQHSTGSP